MTPRPPPDLSAAPDVRVEAQTKSLVRSSVVFAVLAVLIPAALYAVFHRNARHLDALADHGQLVDATVTARRGGTTSYSYTVGGTTHSWSVREGEAPLTVGETFAVTYLPEVPSVSRPGRDRSVAAAEVASNRRFVAKLLAGIFWFFAANFIICRVRLRRLRATGRASADDPQANRTTLILAGGLLLAPMLAIVFGWHATDALRQNQAIWPVVLGGVLALSVLGGTAYYVGRGGVADVRRRSSRLLMWAVPVLIAFAVIRTLASIFTR